MGDVPPIGPSPAPVAPDVSGASPPAAGYDWARIAFEGSGLPVCLVSLEGKLMAVNPAFGQTLGRTEDELVGLDHARLLHPDDLSRSHRCVQALLQGESRACTFVQRYVHRDGSAIAAEVTVTLSRDGAGRPMCFVAALRTMGGADCGGPPEHADAVAEVLGAITEVAMLLTRDLTIVAASPGLAASFGKPLEALVGTPALSHIPEDLAANRKERLLEAISSGEPIHFEDSRAGRVYTNSVYPVLDSAGEVYRLAIFCRDITRERATESALADQTQLLASILAASPVGITLVRDRQPAWTSPALEALVGHTMEEQRAKGSRFLYLDSAEHERVGRILYGDDPDAGPRETDSTWVRADGTTFSVHLSARRLVEDDPSQGHIITASDITERLRREAELRESLALYRGLHDAMPGGLLVYDADGYVIDVNSSAAAIFGLPAEEMVGDRLEGARWSAVREDGTPCGDWRPSRQSLIAGERVRNAVIGLTDQESGCLRWLLINSEPQVDPATGRVARAIVTMLDITELKQAENARRESERRFREMTDLLPDMVFELSPDLRVTYANRAVGEVLGYTQDDLDEGLKATDVCVEPVTAEEVAQLAAPGRPVTWVYTLRAKDGTVIPAEVRAQGITGPDGELTGYRGAVRDITDRRRAEAAEKLAAIGQLAAGVGHEFNNMLAALSLQAEAVMDAGGCGSCREIADLVLRSAAHGGEVCRSLTSFARPAPPQRQAVDVEEVLEAALRLAARPVAGTGIVVRRDYGAHGRWAYGDPGQLQQVFLNLIINACHAMADGGELTLTTRQSDGRIIVSVRDTGTGIAPENLSRLFEPYFTTKGLFGDDGGPAGTGLGLSVSHGIVQAHGGAIEVSSEVGAGTTFTVELPQYAEEPGLAAAPGATAQRAGAVMSSVLVVEDEADLASYIESALAAAGYRVMGVTTLEAALAALSSERFDLVVADLEMPDGGGPALVDAAAALADPPRVIVVTGPEATETALDPPGAVPDDVLRRPFTRDRLLAAASRALTRPGA